MKMLSPLISRLFCANFFEWFVPIQTEPLSRQSQKKLVAFIDECSIVSQSLDGQRDAIKELQTNMNARASPNHSFPLLQDALNTLDEKRSSMEELIDKATEILE